MPIIDERGRVFGRLNLVDAAVVVLVLVLMPAAYGSYRLFKDPRPALLEVLPSKLSQGPNRQTEIRGTNLRPYMRVSFDNLQGRTFLFNSPTSAVVQLPDLAPGTYDVVLFDYMQEVSRLPKAMTIEPTPAPRGIIVDVTGSLISLTPALVKNVVPGQKWPETGQWAAEVLSVGTAVPEVMRIKTGDKTMLTVPVPEPAPLELPVRIRTTCALETSSDGALRCTVGGVALAPDATVHYPGSGTMLAFRVSEVHYPGLSRVATVTVRFVVSPEARAKLKAADRDLGARAHPAGQMATILSLADRGDVLATTLRDANLRQAIPTNRLLAVDAVLTVPVEETPVGWMYKAALVKVGAPFSFETETYTVDGGVTDMMVPARDPAARGPAPVSQ